MTRTHDENRMLNWLAEKKTLITMRDRTVAELYGYTAFQIDVKETERSAIAAWHRWIGIGREPTRDEINDILAAHDERLARRLVAA